MGKRGRRPATDKDTAATTVRYVKDKMYALTHRGYTHSEAYALGVEAILQIPPEAEINIIACRNEERAADNALQQALAKKRVLLARRQKMEVDALTQIRQTSQRPERLDPKEKVQSIK